MWGINTSTGFEKKAASLVVGMCVMIEHVNYELRVVKFAKEWWLREL